MATERVHEYASLISDLLPMRRIDRENPGDDTGWKSTTYGQNLTEQYEYLRYDFAQIYGLTSVNLIPEGVSFDVSSGLYQDRTLTVDFYNGDPFNGGTIFESVSKTIKAAAARTTIPFYVQSECTVTNVLYIRVYCPGSEDTIGPSVAFYSKNSKNSEASVFLLINKPTATCISPVNTQVPGDQTIHIEWSRSTQEGTITETSIGYSTDNGQSFEQIYTAGSATQYDVPAKKFPYGNILWGVRPKNSFGVSGDWASASLTVLQSAPIVQNLKPGNCYINKDSQIQFSWESINSYGTVNGSELEYNLGDGQGWRSLGSVSGTTNVYTVAANTFPALNSISWRVRSKNGNGTWGDWVSTTFATIDATTTATPAEPITNAKRDETTAILFRWSTSNSLSSAPTGADLQWRLSGGEYQELGHVNGNTKQFTAPANTFPGNVIYWRVRAYNQDGVAGAWSSEAYFSTIDTPSVATALSPTGTIEDADVPLTFVWLVSNQSGTESTGADLQYSHNGSTWIDFAYTDGSTTVTVAGGTITPGETYWRVRSYNRNHVAGDWSDALSFVAKAAPAVQDLQVTATPFATIDWQSNDQQNYEIFVDGKSFGVFFGTERQYVLPDYLKDGVHTIGLRVLGSFSLWSKIRETQVTIENTPTAALTLKAPTNIDTALEWTGGTGLFYIYRDGVLIARTNQHSFTDRTALGSHHYQAIERLVSGDYNASAVITRTPDVDCLHIAALSGGDWIPVPHTLKSDSNPQYSESQEVAYNHLAGYEDPVASIGTYRDDSGRYSAVFLFNEQDEHKRFRALRGKPVILKTADGEVMIGILHAWEKKHVLDHYKYAERREIYAAYTFTIQRIGWGDFIDVS